MKKVDVVTMDSNGWEWSLEHVRLKFRAVFGYEYSWNPFRTNVFIHITYLKEIVIVKLLSDKGVFRKNVKGNLHKTLHRNNMFLRDCTV